MTVYWMGVAVGLIVAAGCGTGGGGAAFAKAEVAAFAKTPVTPADTLGLPVASGYVNDFAGLFPAEARAALETRLRDYEAATTRQIAVVTTDSLYGYPDLRTLALALATSWGVGQADTDNGLIILVSAGLGGVEVRTGLGTERELTDAEAAAVIEGVMVPAFRRRDFLGGVTRGLDALEAVW